MGMGHRLELTSVLRPQLSCPSNTRANMLGGDWMGVPTSHWWAWLRSLGVGVQMLRGSSFTTETQFCGENQNPPSLSPPLPLSYYLSHVADDFTDPINQDGDNEGVRHGDGVQQRRSSTRVHVTGKLSHLCYLQDTGTHTYNYTTARHTCNISRHLKYLQGDGVNELSLFLLVAVATPGHVGKGGQEKDCL